MFQDWDDHLQKVIRLAGYELTGDHLRHRADGFLELQGSLVGVAVNLHADEDREAETDPISSQRGAKALNLAFSFQPLDPPQAPRLRQPYSIGGIYIAQSRIGL